MKPNTPPPPSLDPELEAKLVDAAWKARERSYAPYSGFHVGAALLTKSGEIFTGVNVECASFFNTICAERTAACTAVAAGHREFIAVAVVAEAPEPASPCGGCRQFLAEFNHDLIVLYANQKGVIRTHMRALLPELFDDKFLPFDSRNGLTSKDWPAVDE